MRRGRRLRARVWLLLAAASPVVSPTASIAAPAGPAELLSTLGAADLRVATIGYRLATAAAPLCARPVGDIGMVIAEASQYGPALRGEAVARLHLDRGPAVAALVPGGAAERAGLRAGDRLLALDGRSLDASPAAGGAARQDRFTWLVNAFAAAFAERPATIDADRDGQRLSFRFAGDPACASIFQLILDDKLNAGADGNVVSVTYRLASYAARDDELAFVIGHELAHNILGHRRRLDAQGVPRGLLGVLGAGAGRVRETEMEGDYYGVYLMARAGYDPHAAAAFWSRMRRNRGLLWMGGGSHLGDAARIAFLARAAAEIDARRAAGRPLVPDYAMFIAAGA